ncbi:choline ABC transporter substrate-binding protein [Iodobacter sp. CM08]|uniref:choline ABC transporter substrate-binding protein n=1 Tax=Iodobacter sp. CM08 TaxID=3085902 RepID=UPI002981F0DD|nr:choline ABC transporter substrate-binding protein [Iodobacter sp. CM08]MDW5415993.1 choline ABC transporter substrate-binding protein [Iodobacter sp. CM08]
MIRLLRFYPSALLLAAFSSHAIEPVACKTVRFADVGWTDVSATTALTGEVLSALGYQSEVKMLSVPVTFRAMQSKDIDVFLGNWMPTMKNDIEPYLKNGSVESVRVNLTGAKYTLAVPEYVYQTGVHHFSDIAKYSDRFAKRIYGIEAGNDGNRLIANMIKDKAFGLQDFKLIESSEAGMLTQVKRAAVKQQWVVFLGWEPHPMNRNLKLRYLEGGDAYFGPNLGGATVHTTTRAAYTKQCTNVGRLLKNIAFSTDLENQLMGQILDKKQDAKLAARQWLNQNPEQWSAWLDGVNSFSGQPALPVVKAWLKS